MSNGDIATASRDSSVKIWKEGDGDGIFYDTTTMQGHTNFVNALVEIPPTDTFPQGAIASGSTDSLIMVWDLKDLTSPYYTLIGHSNTICSLSYSTTHQTLISGSYDG